MNLILEIILKYVNEEKYYFTFITMLSIAVSVVQTNGISSVVAKIVNIVNELDNKQKKHEIYMLFKYFVLLSVLYLFLNYVYKTFQNKLLTKLRQWMRLELISTVLKHNNENFSDKNFIQLNSPINRISNMSFMFVSDLLSFILPNIVFLFVVFTYFLYRDLGSGIVFVILNFIIFFYIWIIFPIIIEKNKQYEKSVVSNESHLLELLNNVDKVVYRGQTDNEINNFHEITSKTIDKSYAFYSYMNNQILLLNFLMHFIIFCFFYYNIHKLLKNDTTPILFITFVTIIILYRDRMGFIFQQITEFVEFTGRTNGVLDNFQDIKLFSNIKYDDKVLKFDKIKFDNVTFKYKTKDVSVIKNFNLELDIRNKIIGITGQSGRGKSTVVKLLLKMYNDYEGDIYIDDVNIRNINPDYIRKNIIYVNQNFKLFDRLIVENIMYGCSHNESCDENLKYIMNKYKKINELFKDNDIYTTRVGPLGEKMSGGQKVVISIITGLISPSIGLILDEPTVGLDGDLKMEVLNLIKEYKKNKKFILIITHDTDVHKILDEKRDF
jgi:ATP-binding cassette subfamily B protein